MHAGRPTLSSEVVAAVCPATGVQNSLEGLGGPGPVFVLFACASCIVPREVGIVHRIRRRSGPHAGREPIHPDEAGVNLGEGERRSIRDAVRSRAGRGGEGLLVAVLGRGHRPQARFEDFEKYLDTWPSLTSFATTFFLACTNVHSARLVRIIVPLQVWQRVAAALLPGIERRDVEALEPVPCWSCPATTS